MISALSRQADLNGYYVHLLHNFAQEITRLNLEAQDLRNRVLFTLGLLAVYRIGNHIPTPGVDVKALAAFAEQKNLHGQLYCLETHSL